jgi:hypothetical protein
MYNVFYISRILRCAGNVKSILLFSHIPGAGISNLVLKDKGTHGTLLPPNPLI